MVQLKLARRVLLLCVTAGCADAHRAREDAAINTPDGPLDFVDAGPPPPDAWSHPTQLPSFDAGQLLWPDAGGDSLSWICPHDVGVCKQDVMPLLLRASDFGADSQFTAMGRDAVLLQQGATQSVVLITVDDTGEGPSLPQVWSFPAAAGKLLDVVSGEQWAGREGLPRVYALACGSVCSLYEGRADETALREVPSSQVVIDRAPFESTPADLLMIPYAAGSERALCVVGDGVQCFQNGRWQSVIKNEMAPYYLSAAAQSQGNWVAIDELGTLLRKPIDGLATSIGQLPGKVTQLAIQDGLQLQLVVAGRLGYADDASTFRWCAQPNLGAAFISGYSGRTATIIELSGSALLSYDGGDSWCRSSGPSPVTGSELEYGSAPCGTSGNHRMRTSTTIHGQMACEILL